MEKQGHIYVLELQDSCIYVGWSNDVQTRIASHFCNGGSKWTQLHKPISVVSVRPGDTLLETCTTIALMCRYGYEKVRGGSYCNVEMLKAPACITKAQHFASIKSDPEEKKVEE